MDFQAITGGWQSRYPTKFDSRTGRPEFWWNAKSFRATRVAAIYDAFLFAIRLEIRTIIQPSLIARESRKLLSNFPISLFPPQVSTLSYLEIGVSGYRTIISRDKSR